MNITNRDELIEARRLQHSAPIRERTGPIDGPLRNIINRKDWDENEKERFVEVLDWLSEHYQLVPKEPDDDMGEAADEILSIYFEDWPPDAQTEFSENIWDAVKAANEAGDLLKRRE